MRPRTPSCQLCWKHVKTWRSNLHHMMLDSPKNLMRNYDNTFISQGHANQKSNNLPPWIPNDALPAGISFGWQTQVSYPNKTKKIENIVWISNVQLKIKGSKMRPEIDVCSICVFGINSPCRVRPVWVPQAIAQSSSNTSSLGRQDTMNPQGRVLPKSLPSKKPRKMVDFKPRNDLIRCQTSFKGKVRPNRMHHANGILKETWPCLDDILAIVGRCLAKRAEPTGFPWVCSGTAQIATSWWPSADLLSCFTVALHHFLGQAKVYVCICHMPGKKIRHCIMMYNIVSWFLALLMPCTTFNFRESLVPQAHSGSNCNTKTSRVQAWTSP